MPKWDLRLESGDYATVAQRITLFYRAFPKGRIVTDLLSYAGGRVVVRAAVFRAPDEVEPAATGLASEREDDGEINGVACLENTETSAIGRALANLGFTASKQRPSAEEMAKAHGARLRLLRERQREAGTGSGDSPPSDAPRGGESGDDANPGLQAHANVIADVLSLLDAAARLGMSRVRLDALRARLLRGETALPAVLRFERVLARWVAARRSALLLARSDPL